MVFKILKLSEFNDLKHINTQGSGKIFTAYFHTDKYYIKEVLKYKLWDVNKNDDGNYDFEICLNEVLASMIYGEVFKVPVAPMYMLFNDTNAKMQRFMVCSKEIVIDTCAFKTTKDCKDLFNNNIPMTMEPFLVDCILANWDVGADGNVGVIHDGRKKYALRLDVGGALKFRALGALRNFATVPTEHYTMLSPQNVSYHLFKKIKPIQIQRMYELLHSADMAKLSSIKRRLLYALHGSLLLTDTEMLRVRKLFTTFPIIKKRYAYYIENKRMVINSIQEALSKVSIQKNVFDY